MYTVRHAALGATNLEAKRVTDTERKKQAMETRSVPMTVAIKMALKMLRGCSQHDRPIVIAMFAIRII